MQALRSPKSSTDSDEDPVSSGGREVRDHLRRRFERSSDPIAIATSGGMDSSVLVAAALEAGKSPLVVSFTLNDRESHDYRAARRLAAHFDLEFLPVVLPRDREVVLRDIVSLAAMGVRGKAAIECTWPFLYVLEALDERSRCLFVGSAADGHFGLSKKAMINFRYPRERFDTFREAYFSNPDRAQVATLRRIGERYDVDVQAPFFSDAVFDVMKRFSWDELNKPRQKEILRRAFPELNSLGIRRHVNLQLGDSGIAKLLGGVAVDVAGGRYGSPTSAYRWIERNFL